MIVYVENRTPWISFQKVCFDVDDPLDRQCEVVFDIDMFISEMINEKTT